MSRRILILGAGISGLSCAWFLKKRWGSNIEITILEKSNRIGGWIQTLEQDHFIFEQGPRGCRPRGTGIHTLHLVEELGLQDQVIRGDTSACFRYLYTEQKLRKFPHHLLSYLFSPVMKGVFRALLKDLITPKGEGIDESIYDFCKRRLSPQLAERLIDPLISGIYAGDIRQLSFQSCFPFLYRLEQEHGSLIKGILRRPKSRLILNPFVQNLQQYALFSFKRGMETLIRELAHQLEADIRLNCTPQALEFQREGVSVLLSNREKIEADQVFSTLAAPAIGNLLQSHDADLHHALLQIPYASVAVINLGYQDRVLKEKGFGYLIPSQEQEEILGCVWDSCIFPQQNQCSQETRLTVMLGGRKHTQVEFLTEQECLSIALASISKHLGIRTLPQIARVKLAKTAIPQYEVGYQMLLQLIRAKVSSLSTRLMLIGHTFSGISVNDCIAQVRALIT